MTIFYSATARGFFDSDVHQDVPDDARRVAPARHRELIAAQESGAQIVPSPSGSPVLDWPHANAAMRRAAAVQRIKREARRRILLISPAWRQINDLRIPTPAGAERFAAIDAVRGASDLIERDLAQTDTEALDAFPVAEHPLWPSEQDN